MSSPYLGIPHIVAAQNQPEVTANGATDSLDTALNAEANIALVDAPIAATLQIAQMAGGMVLKLTGVLTAARIVVVPNSQRTFIVVNATLGPGSPAAASYPVTVQTAMGTGITVTTSNGYVILYCDGTNVVEVGAASSGSGSLPTPTQIALAPGSSGPFMVAHMLGVTPKLVLIQMTSGGEIWFTSGGSPLVTRYDSSFLYLEASDTDVTGYAICWT